MRRRPTVARHADQAQHSSRAIPARRRRLGDSRTAKDHDRMSDIVLGEQRLRLLIIEHEADAAHIGARKKIGILIGFTIARACDDCFDPCRRIGILRAQFWLMFGQGLPTLARWLSHKQGSADKVVARIRGWLK